MNKLKKNLKESNRQYHLKPQSQASINVSVVRLQTQKMIPIRMKEKIMKKGGFEDGESFLLKSVLNLYV